jgi:hypothetical protein
MAGQSANLTLKEACAMQHRVQHSGSQASSHGTTTKKSGSKSEGSYNPKKKKMY